MGFILPAFNLPVAIWRAGNGPPFPPDVSAPGNLCLGHRGYPTFFAPSAGVVRGFTILLLPALTDVRDNRNGTGFDSLEVPSASGRFYDVVFVEDVGKGFLNEHRMAVITPTGTWPLPLP